MNTAEKLARQIRRVAELRGRAHLPTMVNGAGYVVDAVLERACLAIGSGDEGRMEAIGLELEAVRQ